MSNVDKRKLNKHIRIVDDLYSESKSMERSLYTNKMTLESATYRDISNQLDSIKSKLEWLKRQ